MKLAVFGLQSAGKSSIVHVLHTKQSPTFVSPTFGFTHYTIDVHNLLEFQNGEEYYAKLGLNHADLDLIAQYEVTMYDLGGCKTIRAYWDDYMHDVHGCLFVVDCTRGMSVFDDVRHAFNQVKQKMTSHCKPVLVVCNKQDTQHAM